MVLLSHLLICLPACLPTHCVFLAACLSHPPCLRPRRSLPCFLYDLLACHTPALAVAAANILTAVVSTAALVSHLPFPSSSHTCSPDLLFSLSVNAMFKGTQCLQFLLLVYKMNFLLSHVTVKSSRLFVFIYPLYWTKIIPFLNRLTLYHIELEK